MKKNLRFILIALVFAILALLFSVIVIFQLRSPEGGEVQLPDGGGAFGGLAPGEGGTLPGGTTGSGTIPDGTEATTTEQDPFEEPELPALRQLSANPVAGATFYTDGGDTKIRYMERGTAHVFDTYPRKAEWQRVSHMTIPRVYEAWWYGNGSSTVLRLLDEADGVTENFAANVVPRVAEAEDDAHYQLTGRFLDRGIRSLARLESDQDEVAFLTPDTVSTIFTITTRNESTTAREEIQGSEWQLQWPTANRLYATTNASAAFDGYLFAFIGSADEPAKVLGPAKGLTTLVSPSGRYVLYSESANKTFTLHLYDTEKGTSQAQKLRTLPEKCVWYTESPPSVYCSAPGVVYNGEYPDIWYQGQIHFYDTIFRVDLDSTTVYSVADYGVLQRPMDITNPQLTADGTYLIFTNKIDGILWGLDLEAL